MKLKDLEGDFVFGGQLAALKGIVQDIEHKFDDKLYFDTCVVNGSNWRNICVGLHGDRNLINLVVIRFINWQHMNVRYDDCHLLVYPVEELPE